ncbi:site-specific integrase [Pseudonocardia bannensis]|uniref:Site-specific integrase n=1 Tax=Pseudonocardia bannensis TaxID=630973 RepID=A0A848DF68_9PSEU|nr:site-specific integrase [Pseudonocardia bannensis]
MAVDDLWYLSRRDPVTDERRPSKRHGRGKRWRVRWSDPNTGETRTALFERKAEAERHDADMRSDISRGRYIDPRAGRLTVAEYAEQWRAQQLHRDSTADMVERAFRLHIVPVLGLLPLGDARASHIRGWVKATTENLAASTVHLVYSYVKSMFAAAAADKLIAASPCVGIRLPEIGDRDYFVPEPEQIHRLVDEIADRYSPIPYIAAGCGLRGSEIFGLELDHVDFLAREIHVRQQLKRMPGQPAYLGELKTRTSRRTVELPEVAQLALARHVERYPVREIAIEDRTDPRNVHERRARLLFLTSHHRPLHRSNWSTVWRTAVRRAGLPAGFGLHGLRHYFATLLIHNGAAVKTVQLALGHSSPMITLNTYAHEWPDALDRTRALVDSALGARPTGVVSEARS